MSASRIAKVHVHPLRATLPKVQRTSQGDYPAIEIVVVEVETEDGTVGFGEGLCRRSAAGYARFIEEALVPRLIGRDAADRRALWKAMRAALSGRPGGQIVEAIAAIDIALWDIAGKQAGQPIHRLLGGMGRKEVAAYASSINWLDDATVEVEVAAALKAGFARSRSSSAIRCAMRWRARSWSGGSPVTRSPSMSMRTGPMMSTMR